MQYFVVVQSSAGVRYGEIHTAHSWTSNLVLDQAGTYSFEMPASDPQVVMLQPKRVVVCYAQMDGAVTEIGSGIIDQVALTLDGQGNPTGNVSVSGSDRLRELTYRNVGALLVSGTTGPADIIALAPSGWTLDTVTGHSATAKSITQQYQSETVLDALVKLTAITGEHFRAGVGQSVVWAQNDQPSSGVRAFYGADPAAVEGMDNACVVTGLKKDTDSTAGYIGRVYALGSGTGAAQITLNGASCGYAGYTLGSDSKGHYLQHTSTWSSYGIEAVRVWNDQLTAQGLMETAYEMQRRSITPNESYTLNLIGLTSTIAPGSTIRVIAHQWLDNFHAVNIDGDLTILSVSNQLDAQGLHTIGLTCSTTDRPVMDDTAVLVDRLSQVVSTMTYDQPVAGANVVGPVSTYVEGPVSAVSGNIATYNGTTGKIIQDGGVSAASFAPAAHNILSANHGDSVAASVVRGDVLVGNSTPNWARLALGKNGATLRSDGTDLIYTTNVQRRMFSKDNIADNVATSIFRISTTDESGSTDGGGYTVLLHALVGHILAAGSGADAAKGVTAQFCHVNIGAGTATTSAVLALGTTASAASSASLRDIGTVTITTVATSNYQTDIKFQIDLTGSSVQYAEAIVEVELIWWGYTTPPTMTQL